MSRDNRVESRALLMRISPATEHLLEELAERGLYGKNKAEVANFILREWIWSNTSKLKEHGVNLDVLGKTREAVRGKGA